MLLKTAQQKLVGPFFRAGAELVKRYTASVDFDKRMAEFDIQGSLAHAQMLNKVGVLSAGTSPQSRTAWQKSSKKSRTGKFRMVG